MRNFPNEIILLVLLNLNDKKDIISFTSTCIHFFQLRKDELFWRDLIQRKYKIKYRDPNQTWWNLCISEDVKDMCHHINHYHSNNLVTKRQLLWYQFGNHDICLEPICQSVTCCLKHTIVLRLSTLHFMEIWCHACHRSIGFNRPEKYMCRKIIKYMSELPTLRFIQSKRLIEQRLFCIQQNNFQYQYIIDKTWFMSWINFLTGKTNILPTCLNNAKLFKQTKLRNDLIIGVDYELVTEFIADYIERIYGLKDNSIILSINDFKGQPTYRSISQSSLLHRNYLLSE